MNPYKNKQAQKLLSREDFKRLVFARDKNKCVRCSAPAVDAHHICERKLWPDGGYYMDNGASLCEKCHWNAEKSIDSCEVIRNAAGIKTILLPPDLDPSKTYDKWGKEIPNEKDKS